MRPFRHRVSLRAVAALLCVSVPLLAQPVNAARCKQARAEEEDRHQDNLAALQKRHVDIENAFTKERFACRNNASCVSRAAEKHETSMVTWRQDGSEENSRYAKAQIDIGRGVCTSRATPIDSAAGRTVAPTEQEGPILATDDTKRLFKLSAEMNELAQEFDVGQARDPITEFGKGLGDFLKGTIDLLAQKPGVPVQQQAQGIIDYLTNDNAANHKLLLQAAKGGIQAFQANPARFLGQNLPTMLPGPGVLGKAAALRQLSKVEQAAGRLRTLVANKRAWNRNLNKAMGEVCTVGSGVGPARDLADNACLDVALMNSVAIEHKSPFIARGVHKQGVSDRAQTPAQVSARLRALGEKFAAQNPVNYTAPELGEVAVGNPIGLRSLGEIRHKLLTGPEDSQGIVFAQLRADAVNVGDPGIHAFNGYRDKGFTKFLDGTLNVNTSLEQFQNKVELWWYFPLR